MEYKIIKAVSSEYLETSVTGEIRKGWKPIGGFILDTSTEDLFGHSYYMQTMIKAEKGECNGCHAQE